MLDKQMTIKANIDKDASNTSLPNDKIFLTLGKILGADLSLEDLLANLASQLVQGLPLADAGTVYLYNRNRRQLIAEASYGYSRNNAKCSLLPREGAPGRCYALCQSLLFPSAEAVVEQTATLRPTSLNCHNKMRQGLPPTLSMIVVPLTLQEKIFGVILLEHYQPQHRAFGEADLLQLEALGSWISLLIDDVQSHLELKHNKRSYRELLGKFIATSEKERKEIAREIHDEVNQLLLSIRLNLEDIESTIPAEMVNVRGRLEVIRSHINRVFDELHQLSLSLRPPALDELGLPQALDWHIQNLSKEAGLPITLEVKGLSQRRPAPIIETQLFRIAQEALSNVVKHAKATSATIKLQFNKSQMVLLAEDNGTGFDVNTVLCMSGTAKNLGLLGMTERVEICGGTLEIDSTPGHGTRLKVEIPINSYDWGAY